MEKVCELGAKNTKLQQEIDTLEQIISNISEVNSVDICWQDSVVLDCVSAYLSEEVEFKKIEKEINKKEMTNILVQALPQ